MDWIFWLGTAAALLTTAAFLPQVIKAHTSQRTQDLSLAMYVMFSCGLLLWIIYGLAYRALPIIAANSVTLLLSLSLIYLKIKHD